MKDLTSLRKIAEEATPGPWEVDGPANAGPDDTLVLHNNDGGAIAYVQPLWDDAHHIATFDPPTVLALLSRLEQAEENLASALEANKRWAHRSSRQRSELFKAELRAEQAVADYEATTLAVQRVREVATGDPTEYGWSEAMLAVLRSLDGE